MKKNMVILLVCTFFFVISFKPVGAQVNVGITVTANIPPPPLPVYSQPPCPIDGYLWCPGYWAYTDDGYFWVPGVWVLPPLYGYLWTPPYWGFWAGVYSFHPGYWGPHVGFYGGVNYGYGYNGSGFSGGRWEGKRFRYNTAVANVNKTVIHNTYIDKTVIVKNLTVNNRRISYNGGPGGIAARPGSREQIAFKESHIHATAEQTAQVQRARTNKVQFASVNHGHPATVVMNKPETHMAHERQRIQTAQPAGNPTANINPHHPSASNATQVYSMHNHPAKKYNPPTIPRHHIPLDQPKPDLREHPSPQQPHRYSRQEYPNLQVQHAGPQREHGVPQQQHFHAQQPQQFPEPHNPPSHNPERSKGR